MIRRPFSVHPAVRHLQGVARNLHEKTGITLTEWAGRLLTLDLPDAKARKAWLQAQGLGGTQAGLVLEQAEGGGSFPLSESAYLEAAPSFVEAQFSGKKSHLRPLFDALLDLAYELGSDVGASPCATIVPLYRNHVFAQLKASTLTRVDLGLALGDPTAIVDPSGRLIDTGGFAKKDRITHRIEVKALTDLDEGLRGWLRQAYEADGPKSSPGGGKP